MHTAANRSCANSGPAKSLPNWFQNRLTNLRLRWATYCSTLQLTTIENWSWFWNYELTIRRLITTRWSTALRTTEHTITEAIPGFILPTGVRRDAKSMSKILLMKALQVISKKAPLWKKQEPKLRISAQVENALSNPKSELSFKMWSRQLAVRILSILLRRICKVFLKLNRQSAKNCWMLSITILFLAKFFQNCKNG